MGDEQWNKFTARRTVLSFIQKWDGTTTALPTDTNQQRQHYLSIMSGTDKIVSNDDDVKDTVELNVSTVSAVSPSRLNPTNK